MNSSIEVNNVDSDSFEAIVKEINDASNLTQIGDIIQLLNDALTA
jgi:hypothetical protein